MSFCLFCSSRHAFTTQFITCCFVGFGIFSKGVEPVDSPTWTMYCMYSHHDLLRESLKGRLIETSSGCTLLVQPPGIMAKVALNPFAVLSVAFRMQGASIPPHAAAVCLHPVTSPVISPLLLIKYQLVWEIFRGICPITSPEFSLVTATVYLSWRMPASQNVSNCSPTDGVQLTP